MKEYATGLKPKNLRAHNLRTIINLFREHDTLSVRDLCGHISLSKTSILKIVGQLIDAGMVQPAGKGESTEEGGKRPELFRLNADYRYCISIVYRDYLYYGELFDLKLNSRLRLVHRNRSSSQDGYQQALDAIAAMICDLLQKSGLTPGQLCGVVIGSPGIVDAQSGVILHQVWDFPWENNVPFQADLSRKLPFPARIYLDNACRYSGYYELFAGTIEEEASAAVVSTFEKGIGGCLIERGQLIHGVNGLLGEFGHIKTDDTANRACSCGGRGCFETMVNAAGLIATAYEYDDGNSVLAPCMREKSLTYQKIFAAADQGDALACRVVDRAVDQFIVLIQNIRFLCDTQQIVIQGMYAASGRYFRRRLADRLAAMPFYDAAPPTVVFSTIDPYEAPLTGGALYAINQFFKER